MIFYYYEIEYKIILLTFKGLRGIAPVYISDMLIQYLPGRSLRSAHKHLLVVPKSNCKSFGDRAFSVAAPRLWYNLPVELRSCNSLNMFKKLLKTHLFKRAY